MKTFPTRARATTPGVAPPAPAAANLSASLKLALAGNTAMRIAGPATGLLLTSYYLPYLNERHQAANAFVVGALSAAYYAAELSCSPLLGALSDRRGRRPFLLLGPLVGAIAAALLGVTTTVVLLIATQFLQGLSTAASTPAILGQLSEETARDAALRGRVLSIFEVTTAIGALIGTAGAAGLWLVWGRGSFLAVACCYLLATALFARLRPAGRTVAVTHSWRASLALVGRQRALLTFLPAWLALTAITNLWLTQALYQLRVTRPGFTAQYLAGRFANHGTGLALVVLTFALAFCAGALLWGYLGLRRLHEVTVMRIGLLAMLGVCAAIWLVNHSGGNGVARAIGAVAYFGLVLVESGFAPAAVAYLALHSGRLAADRGLVMGLYTVITGSGALLGAAIGAPFAQWAALDGILLVTVFLALAALALLTRQDTA
jgi:MFS family permease